MSEEKILTEVWLKGGECSEFDLSFPELRDMMDDLEDKNPDHVNFRFSITTYSDYPSEYMVYAERHETDFEFESRLRRQAAARKAAETRKAREQVKKNLQVEKDLATLAELRKKYPEQFA